MTFFVMVQTEKGKQKLMQQHVFQQYRADSKGNT
jgi:hypothetical protein